MRYLWIPLLVAASIGLAHGSRAEAQEPGKVWTETLETKWSWPPWETEEQARRYPPELPMERRARQRGAEVVNVERAVEVKSGEWKADGSTMWWSRSTYVVTFRRGTSRAAKRLLDVINTTLPDLEQMLRALTTAIQDPLKRGLLQNAPAVAALARIQRDAVNRVRALKEGLEGRLAGANDQIDDELGEFESATSEARSAWRSLSPQQQAAVGSPGASSSLGGDQVRERLQETLDQLRELEQTLGRHQAAYGEHVDGGTSTLASSASAKPYWSFLEQNYRGEVDKALDRGAPSTLESLMNRVSEALLTSNTKKAEAELVAVQRDQQLLKARLEQAWERLSQQERKFLRDRTDWSEARSDAPEADVLREIEAQQQAFNDPLDVETRDRLAEAVVSLRERIRARPDGAATALLQRARSMGQEDDRRREAADSLGTAREEALSKLETFLDELNSSKEGSLNPLDEGVAAKVSRVAEALRSRVDAEPEGPLRRRLEGLLALAQSFAPTISGFTYLREEVFSAGGIRRSVQVYQCDAFANALGLGHGRSSVACEFVLIPRGSFLLGSPLGEGLPDERPQQQVTLGSFLLARTEVTQAVWQQLMGDNPSFFDGVSDRPVEKVTWTETQDFCRKAGLRLPSEAEWEYACRAGSEGAYCYGDGEGELDRYAEYKGNNGGETKGVGGKLPNAFGLYDVHGNVWEWCQDAYFDNYQGTPADGSARDSAGTTPRVQRGGCWDSAARTCRSARRVSRRQDAWNINLGFRPARSLP